jgi:hypothetical protein
MEKIILSKNKNNEKMKKVKWEKIIWLILSDDAKKIKGKSED